MISILLVFSLLAVSEGEGASPTELIDWSTGWGGLDPSEQSKVKKMVEDAKHREEMAHKELLEAQRDEERAEQTQKKLPEGQAPAVTPVRSQVLRLPSSSKVAAAKRFAEEQATLARSAEQAAQKHLERAEMAAQHVKKAPDVRSKDQAEQQAKAEAGLATEAEHNATVKKLEAKIAQDKVRLMEMSLRGSQGETYPWLEYALVGTGLFMLSLCAFLVFGRAPAKTEPLQEPLLEDPMWNEEGSAEEWKQRAMAALDLSNKSKAMAAEFKAEAEAKESRHAEQMGALEAKMKADSEVARSELLEKCTALEARAEDSQRALQAKGEEAEKAQKELDALKSTIQADSGAADAVQQEERLAQAHAELATLHERLRLAQESLDRSKEESRSAQAAAEEAQNLHRQALSKVDLNAEVEKARADEKEGSLKLMEQEHESKVKEVSELTSQIQLGRQKTSEMEEELSKAQQRVQELQGEAEAASKAREMTAKEKAEVEQKLAVANEEKLEIEKQLNATKEEHSKAKGEAQRMAAELQVHSDSLEKQSKKAEEIQSSLDEHKLHLRQAQTDADQAKQAVQDSSQAMEAVRQQAAVEIAQHKKAVEDLQGDLKKHAATLESHQLEAENEKMRADLAESIAKSRQEELEAAQRLAEKSKAALQSVRQELTAECSAAKAQVEVERKLALEAEEMAEKFRLETQAARSAEQQARISEQEAKAVINKLKQSAAGCDDTALLEMRKQLASAQGEAEKAKNDLRSLREAKAATEASEATEIPGTVA